MNRSTIILVCIAAVAVVVISGIAISDAVRKHNEDTAQVEVTITKVYHASTRPDGKEVYTIRYTTANVYKYYVIDFYAAGHYIGQGHFGPESSHDKMASILAPPVVPTLDNVHFVVKPE